MSLADKASLLLIPTGYNAQKVYSIFPTSGVGDFTFSRSGSATRIAKNGLITTVDSNIPRLEYPLIDGVVSGCPSLLLEPQSTNLVTYSEDFSNAAWTKSNSSIVSNSTISPDGTLNASKLTVNTSAGYLAGTFISSGNTDITVSFFVKSDTLSNFNFAESFYFGTITNFDLSNGTTDNGKIENYGNGWFRCSKTYTYASGQQIVAIQIKTGTVGSLYIFGGQYEQGSYPTSYIKTNGSPTTRSAETANGSGDAATFNDSEGVLMAEISALDNDLTNRYISISDGTANNRILIRYVAGFSNTVGLFAVVGGTEQATLLYEVNDILDNIKVLIKYKQNDYSLWVNGFEVDTDTIGIVPSENTLDRLNFANIDGSTFPFYGKTKQVQYYDSALTDSELEQLTSWTSFTDMAQGQQYSIK